MVGLSGYRVDTIDKLAVPLGIEGAWNENDLDNRRFDLVIRMLTLKSI